MYIKINFIKNKQLNKERNLRFYNNISIIKKNILLYVPQMY